MTQALFNSIASRRPQRLPAVVALTTHLLVTSTTFAQLASWTELTPLPGPRSNHAMAYDSARGVTVLFGGHDGFSRLGDTWE